MKKFAFIVDGRVNIILDEFNPDFPGIELKDRYAPEIINNLVEVPENLEVTEGMDYNIETNTFSEHVEDDFNSNYNNMDEEDFLNIEEILPEGEEPIAPAADGNFEKIEVE